MELIFSPLHNLIASKELFLPSPKFRKDAHCIVLNLPQKGIQRIQRSQDGQFGSLSAINSHLQAGWLVVFKISR